jgi:ectoine hydroxylase-related dioxygenase (phytanoyl-CoA dioxygenase family)
MKDFAVNSPEAGGVSRPSVRDTAATRSESAATSKRPVKDIAVSAVEGTMDMNEYLFAMGTRGFVVFRNVIPAPLVAQLRAETDAAISKDKADGVSRGNFFYLAHTRGSSFARLLDLSPLQSYIDAILSDTCIIHSYNGIDLRPHVENPVQNAIHRDSPRFSRQYPLSVQILYMIDGFTRENGATYCLPGSHQIAERPSDRYFAENAVQIEGSAGDAMIFDSMVWHAGGENKTAASRRGLTAVYTRSFMKQQIDLPRATPPELVAKLSERSRRLLGFNVRVPASMDEFLLPADQRLYKADQG